MNNSGSSIIETLVAITVILVGSLGVCSILDSSHSELVGGMDRLRLSAESAKIIEEYDQESFKALLRKFTPLPQDIPNGATITETRRGNVNGSEYTIRLTARKTVRFDVPESILIDLTATRKGRKSGTTRLFRTQTLIPNLGT
jgi:hypothetical protein